MPAKQELPSRERAGREEKMSITSAENSSISMLLNILDSFDSKHLATASRRMPKQLNAFYEEARNMMRSRQSVINGPWSSLNVQMQMWQMNLVQAL